MQDGLYPLTVKDIEAIGRARVSRTIPSNIKIWVYVSMALFMVGLGVTYVTGNTIAGMAIMIAGVAVLWGYTSNVDKKRKSLVRELKKEWKEGQGVK